MHPDTWSRYAQGGGRAPREYHRLVTVFLERLCERSGSSAARGVRRRAHSAGRPVSVRVDVADDPRGKEPGGEEPTGEEAGQAGSPAAAPGARSSPGHEAVQAQALLDQLGAAVRLPTVVAAALAGAVGAGITLAAGFLLSALLPDDSLLGAVGQDAGIVTEALRQVVQTLFVAVYDEDVLGPVANPAPFLLVAIPVGAAAAGAALAAPRTAGMAPTSRLVAGAATGVPFGLAMLLIAILAGEEGIVSPSLGSALVLGVLWGSVGGALGIRARVGPAGGPGHPWLERARPAVPVARALLGPLAALVAACALLGSAVWIVQAAQGVGSAGASRPAAVGEAAAFVVENGLAFAELGAGVRFEDPGLLGALGMAFPVERVAAVTGDGDGYRLFDLREGMPAYVFVVVLVVLVALPLGLALMAGFAAAAARSATSPALGAAWGALVGPAWALTLVIVAGLVQRPLHGEPDSESLFSIVLLLGALVGAAGGLLAARAAASAAPAAPPATGEPAASAPPEAPTAGGPAAPPPGGGGTATPPAPRADDGDPA